ncbi:hypothetical protein CANMA_001005 [Candida margitis]|uniref:uncharacterized protein n=1 Tax=Candida margitis TaxID=1775924 RepID=UPI002226BBD5|nr:uncharacterized protein CANMA_001005 [Candida margitis]KAI5969965.1 hypothetical protein CANMA_001005 [Candida margitis]
MESLNDKENMPTVLSGPGVGKDPILDLNSNDVEKQGAYEPSQKQSNISMLGFDLSDNFMNNVANNKVAGTDLSILDKVRNRLLGENKESQQLDETQKLDQDETQIVPNKVSDNQFQHLPQLEVDENEYIQSTQVIEERSNSNLTQVINKSRVLDPTQVINKSTTLDPTQIIGAKRIKPAIANSSVVPTQAIRRNDLQNLFVESDEEEEEETQPMTAEERQRKIVQLAEEKKQARLEKERELLEQDMTKGSLTDEEDELNNEANDTVVSSHMKSDGLSTKELEKAQQFLNIQKRQIDIRPDFERKQVFTKEKFLDLFSEDDEEEDDDDLFGLKKKTTHNEKPSSPTIEELLKSSPTTSPVKNNAFDLFSVPSKPTQSSNPLELYAQRLKQGLPSSPSNNQQGNNGGPLINLDSDSDVEIGHSSSPLRTQHKSRFSNHAKELDVIPELTKEQKFLIRQRFAKKKYQNSIHASKDSDKHKQQSNFFKQLQRRNIDQLKVHRLNDPEHALMEELEKNEESMTSLLEREMERVRKIRKKEKLQERAKSALLGKTLGMKMVDSEDDGDYDQDIPESDVADSEVPESDFNSDNFEQPGYDDDDDNENQDVKNDYNESFEDDDGEENRVTHDDDSHELFKNLQPRNKDESFMSTQGGDMPIKHEPNLPSFKDLSQSQIQSQTQNHTQVDQPTQVDTSTLGELETQIIKKQSNEGATQADRKNAEVTDEDEDDDMITPARVNRGRKAMRNKMIQIKEEPEDQPEKHEEDEEDPEVIQQRIKEYEQKIRRKELEARKRRKELEKSGMKTMFDGEAEESEDEWKGLGGMDGEFSDVANSEDERMIDNNLNIDLQNDEIRQKFMEEYQIKDQKELEKLLDDIKNHKLIKRVGQNNNGFDIELSDEEDQLLAAYRKQKLIEQQQRLLQNKKLQALSKDEKSKAFFDTIQDKHETIVIDSDVEEIGRGVANPFGGSKESSGKETTPHGDVNDGQEDDKNGGYEEDSLEKEAPLKQTIKIEESFVHNKLSFLYQSVYDDENDSGERGYNRIQKLSKLQHGISDDDDDGVEDITALKSRSILQHNRQVTNIDHKQQNPRKRKLGQDTLFDNVDGNKQDGGDTDKDEDEDNNDEEINLDVVDVVDGDEDDEFDDDFMPIFKKPSITQSFKSFQEQKGMSFNKNGKQHFSGVTISKQYKVVSGSKASITYMSSKSAKARAQQQPSLKSFKERQIEKSLRNSRKERGEKHKPESGSSSTTSSRLFTSSDFL